MLFGQAPSYDHLRIFGCLCYVGTYPKQGDKFDPRAKRCVFVGYPQGQKGWKVYNPKTRKFHVSRDVVFYENVFPHTVSENKVETNSPTYIHHDVPAQEEEVKDTTDEGDIANQENREEEFSGNLGDSDEPIMEVQNEGEMHAETENAALASRTRQPPSYLKDYYCHAASHDPLCMSPSQPPSSGKVYPITNYLNYNCFSPRHQAYLAAVMSHEELRNYREAIQKPEWQEAMAHELKALEDNETWDVALPPKGNKVMGCKWVYKVKYKALGEVEKYKVRLVAKGYTQVEGEDFNETFAPVAKMTTVRCLPSIAIARDWELHQMDVSNAFLHGDLEEEVYMQAPEGYKVPKEGMVCRL